MKLCSLQIKNETVCEVVADYPLLFGTAPRLNPRWLRVVLAQALCSYFLRQGKPAEMRRS